MSRFTRALNTAAFRNPFPGLRPFRDDEDFLFFGRESQVNTMVDKLAATRFLAVVGTSGSGKSSLVNCGLKPALHRGLMAKAGTSWRIAQFRPGGDPIQAMARALAAKGVLFGGLELEGLSLTDMIEATLRMSKLGLVDIYEQAQPGEKINLLVVVDQFEELFRFRNLGASSPGKESDRSQEAIAFINLLLEARAQANLPIYIVLTMRSDFLGDCAQLPGLPEAINEGQYLVPRMSREEIRSAISGPVGVGGAEISPVLLTRLVNDVGDNPDQLSILQHALNRTWARWENEGGREGPLALPHYEAIGTMTQALDQHAEKAYGELQEGRQKNICEKIFKALTDKGTDARGIRRPTSLETLCALSGARPEEVGQVINVFRKPSRSFLMPPLPETLEPSTVIDISHESLMRVWNRLKTWGEEEAESAAQYRRLAQSAALHAKGRAKLMEDPELSLMLAWREKNLPNAAWADRYLPGFELAESFLEKSRGARDAAILAEEARRKRELRRTRLVAIIIGVAALVATAFGGYALSQRTKATVATEEKNESEKQRKKAEEQEKEADRQRKEAERLKDLATVSEIEAKDQKRLADIEKANALAAREEAVQANAKLGAALEESKLARAAAEREAEIAKTRAEAVSRAVMAQADAQAAKDKVAGLQKELRDPRTTEKRQIELQGLLRSATENARTLAQEADRASAAAALVSAGGQVLQAGSIRRDDLFDVSQGIRVTGSSGLSGAGNNLGMFGAGGGTPSLGLTGNGQGPAEDVVTFFKDGKPAGFRHFVEWQTKDVVNLQSIGLFARHDAVIDGYQFRRAFSNFKLYAKQGTGWVLIADYSPALPYGGGENGTALAVCLAIKPISAREFRAEFTQAVDILGQYSAPRIVALDGYSQPQCSKAP